MNYTVKQTNGKVFHYTNLLEAIDGYIDNYNVSFSSTLYVEQEGIDKVLVNYNDVTDEFTFNVLFKDSVMLFMGKIDERMDILISQF